MNMYQKFSDINQFDSICGCFSNLCSLSMGCLFPQCLFGRIYELSGFGECFVGCCKICSLQFIINAIFSSIIINKEINTLYNQDYITDIKNCSRDTVCKDYNYTEIYDNNCSLNNTVICDCLRKPLVEKCHWEHNLPNTLNDLFYYIFIISMVNVAINLNINGIFFGHYRTKISQKYNILHNSRYDFCIHFMPCIHQLALCQEYNTVYRIEYLDKPVYAVNTI
jgi:Cys-rich protein (TIGR01571 family)